MQRTPTSQQLKNPDDLAVGDRVAVLRARYELVPFNDDAALTGGELEPERITLIPGNAGVPLKVVGVSLPFVMVRDPEGGRYPLDVRRHALVRVAGSFAKSARAKAKRGKGKRGKKRCRACGAKR